MLVCSLQPAGNALLRLFRNILANRRRGHLMTTAAMPRFDDIDGLIGHYKSNGSGLAVKLTVNAIVEVPKRPPPR